MAAEHKNVQYCACGSRRFCTWSAYCVWTHHENPHSAHLLLLVSSNLIYMLIIMTHQQLGYNKGYTLS